MTCFCLQGWIAQAFIRTNLNSSTTALKVKNSDYFQVVLTTLYSTNVQLEGHTAPDECQGHSATLPGNSSGYRRPRSVRRYPDLSSELTGRRFLPFVRPPDLEWADIWQVCAFTYHHP